MGEYREFENVIGYEDVKAELIRICDVLRFPEKYKKNSRRVLIINLPADVIIAIYLSEHLHLHILRILCKLNSHFS